MSAEMEQERAATIARARREAPGTFDCRPPNGRSGTPAQWQTCCESNMVLLGLYHLARAGTITGCPKINLGRVKWTLAQCADHGVRPDEQRVRKLTRWYGEQVGVKVNPC